MPETCKAKYHWTREQLIVAMQRHQATKISRGVVLLMKIFSLVLLVFIAIVLLASLLLSPTSAPPWALLLLVAICIYVLILDRVNAWFWGRRFAQRPDADMEIEWEFSKQEIRFGSALAVATLHWKGFIKVVEAGDGFLFYSLVKLFHWIPFSAFESTECVKVVRALVTENNIPLVQLRKVPKAPEANTQ
jgi:uncharacterized membrane protein YbhN (UPF0104 family)